MYPCFFVSARKRYGMIKAPFSGRKSNFREKPSAPFSKNRLSAKRAERSRKPFFGLSGRRAAFFDGQAVLTAERKSAFGSVGERANSVRHRAARWQNARRGLRRQGARRTGLGRYYRPPRISPTSDRQKQGGSPRDMRRVPA